MEGVGAFSVRRGGRVGGRFLFCVRPGFGVGEVLFGADRPRRARAMRQQ